MSQQPSGWYDDPSNPEMLRYWDGVMWTNHTAPKKSTTASQSTIGMPQQQEPPVPQAPQQTTPMPQGGPWQGQNAPGQAQYPPQYQPYPQAPGAAWMTAGPSTTDGVPLASWGRRAVARILDGIITGILTTIFAWPWVNELTAWYTDVIDQAIESGTQPDTMALSTQLMEYALPITIVGFVVGIVYETFFLVRSGATPGKMALGISVRRTAQPGRLDVTTAVKRQLIQIVASLTSSIAGLSTLTGLISFVDYLWPLWDRKRQALHDKIADTQVVRGKQPRQQP